MIILFIGDSDNLAKQAALANNSSATFIEDKNINQYYSADSGVFFSGLAFITNLDKFSKICLCADEIFYCPPARWSDSDKLGHSEQQKYTEIILSYARQYATVHGLNLNDNPYKFLDHDYRLDKRKIAGPQMWAVGCSITQGDGVEIDQTWKHIASHHYGVPYSDLSLRGSSIIWQSDQICQADIRPGDKVFWGLTTHTRLPVIYEQDNTVFHLHAGSYQKKHLRDKVVPFPIDLLTNKSLIYHNVMAVRRAVNFCQKLEADIVILALMYDWDLIYNYFNVRPFRQAISWPDQWLDFGSDHIHPGQLQHAKFSQQFIQFHYDLYD
jgi:hypothetical protein